MCATLGTRTKCNASVKEYEKEGKKEEQQRHEAKRNAL